MTLNTSEIEKLLIENGFSVLFYPNPNDDSDPTVLKIYCKGGYGVGETQNGWGLFDLGHDVPLLKYPVKTLEDIVNGLKDVGVEFFVPPNTIRKQSEHLIIKKYE